MTERYPLRVRLHGGRATHAARPTDGGTHHNDRITACDYFLAAYSTNHWMPNTATITCSRCQRAVAKAGA